jgi:hypothetical protein
MVLWAMVCAICYIAANKWEESEVWFSSYMLLNVDVSLLALYHIFILYQSIPQCIFPFLYCDSMVRVDGRQIRPKLALVDI